MGIDVLYISVQFILPILLLWLSLCVPDCVTMSSPPSLHQPSARPTMPSSSCPASFAEALILGGGGSCPVSTLGTTSPLPLVSEVAPPPVSAPSDPHTPSHSTSMHSLCLLGKPWGEPIPLSIVISKTRKDWGFAKGQIDYLDLGNGWILFQFANL